MASAFKLDSIDIITNDSSTQAWGASVSGLGYTFHRRLVYQTDSASGGSSKAHTYTKGTGVTALMVYVTGGGGAGGANQDHSNYHGGNGAAGGTTIKFITATTNDSTPTSFLNTTTVTVTVGHGGTCLTNQDVGTTATQVGGTSSFGTFCTATGGTGGAKGGGIGTNVVGGVGSGGDINLTGQGGGIE